MKAIPRIGFWNIMFALLMAAGIAATWVRFTQGLGASTALTDEYEAELEAAVAAAQASGKAREQLTREDFPLPSLANESRHWLRELAELRESVDRQPEAAGSRWSEGRFGVSPELPGEIRTRICTFRVKVSTTATSAGMKAS